ncbi:hypothetical protein ACTFIW_002395, partial [Dictyostelium discoideum]
KIQKMLNPSFQMKELFYLGLG